MFLGVKIVGPVGETARAKRWTCVAAFILAAGMRKRADSESAYNESHLYVRQYMNDTGSLQSSQFLY
jgi:hypothetical protein